MALSNHPQGLDRPGRVFRWTKNGNLYLMAERIYGLAGVDHGGAPFHVMRHSYGAWLRAVGADLVATGAWKSRAAASVYEHLLPRAEAEKVLLVKGATRV